MKKINFCFAIAAFFLISACQPEAKKADIQAEKKAVELVLENYVIANETQDLAKIEEIWYPSEQIVSFGTEKGEKLVGISRIKEVVNAQFQTFKNTYISSHDQIIEVSDDGNTAWFSEIINYNFILNEQALTYEGLSYTGVLKKFEGKWKLVLTHMSIPANPIRN